MKSSDRHSTTFPPQTALPQVDQLRAIAVAPVRPLGTYCPLPNGFGIDDEVVISTRHLRRPSAEILRTLLHEMVHQWQHRHGRPGKTRGSHHNLEFRAKCAELGIPCDARGCSVGIVAGSPFHVLLRTHGAGAQDSLRAAARVAGAGPAPGSKLKKWHCGCTNVRCAVELDARCQRCGERFECAEPRGTARPDANVATPRTALSAPVLRTAASRGYTGPDRDGKTISTLSDGRSGNNKSARVRFDPQTPSEDGGTEPMTNQPTAPGAGAANSEPEAVPVRDRLSLIAIARSLCAIACPTSARSIELSTRLSQRCGARQQLSDS